MKTLRETLQKMYDNSKNRADFISMSEILKRKIEKNLVYPSTSMNLFEELRNDIIQESILDPVHKERMSIVFDKNDKMKKDLKDWIIQKISEWRNGLDFEITLSDIHLYGSSTGYQYSETADVDLHAIVDLTDEQLAVTGRLIQLGNVFDNNKNPATLFLIKKDEPLDMKKFENLYDIQQDKWLKKADKNEYEVPYAYILELSQFFMNAFDLSISQYERAKHEYKTYLSLNPDKQEITEIEKNRVVEKALFDLRAAHDRLRLGKQVMMSFAKEGYEEGKDFQIHILYNTSKDPRLSVNNSVYKMLERFGYKDKIYSALKEAKELIPGPNDSMDSRKS